jgi:hypothetical protein
MRSRIRIVTTVLAFRFLCIARSELLFVMQILVLHDPMRVRNLYFPINIEKFNFFNTFKVFFNRAFFKYKVSHAVHSNPNAKPGPDSEIRQKVVLLLFNTAFIIIFICSLICDVPVCFVRVHKVNGNL